MYKIVKIFLIIVETFYDKNMYKLNQEMFVQNSI